VKHNFALLQIW